MVVFPSNPNVGDTITDPDTGSTWLWDGVKWTFGPAGGGGGGNGDDNYFELLTPVVIWTASTLTQIVGSFTLPAGDWDISGTIATTMRFADLQWLVLTGTINGVPIPQLAPFQQGDQLIASATNFALPLSTFRVLSADAPADVVLSLTLNYFNPMINPDALVYIRGRRWDIEAEAVGFGEYLEYAPDPVSWATSGPTQSLGIMPLPEGSWDVTGIVSFNGNGGDLRLFAASCWPDSQAFATPGFGGALSGEPLVSGAQQYNATLSTWRMEGPVNVDIRLQLQFANVENPTAQLWLRARRWS